jgi:hypothetical protein
MVDKAPLDEYRRGEMSGREAVLRHRPPQELQALQPHSPWKSFNFAASRDEGETDVISNGVDVDLLPRSPTPDRPYRGQLQKTGLKELSVTNNVL